MEKDRIFFAESGLTSTSANHIANLAKELYKGKETALNGIVFYTTTVKLLGTSEESLLRQGNTDLNGISEGLKFIAELKALIAWLREAIKAKERLISEAQVSSYEDYGIEVPVAPEKESPISSDDYIASLSIKERNRYYFLEACCATIGEYIHPNGCFATERDMLYIALKEPNVVSGSGRDTLLYTKTPTISATRVEDTFMSLQNEYREYQAELNSIKFKVEEAVNADAIAKNAKYSKEMGNYKTLMEVANAELEEKRKQAILNASNLKITIPDSLKHVYDKVSELGK